MELKELEIEFIGQNEVKGFKFKQVYKDEKWYIYEVDGKYHEVFKRKSTAICIDFAKRIYSETEYREIYPRSKQFGMTAWTIYDLEKCYDKIKQINAQDESYRLSRNN